VTWWAVVVVAGLFCWAFAEATIWPVMPDMALFLVVLFAPDIAFAALSAVAVGSAAGGFLGITLLRAGRSYPRPLTTARMEARTEYWLERGPVGLVYQLATAVPYKVFVAAAAVRGFRRSTWAALTILFRGARMALVAAFAVVADSTVRSLAPGDVAVAKLGVAVASSALFLIMWRLAYAVWSRPAKAHP
jgi:membrane protein YqaA with SNARE-associated domain